MTVKAEPKKRLFFLVSSPKICRNFRTACGSEISKNSSDTFSFRACSTGSGGGLNRIRCCTHPSSGILENLPLKDWYSLQRESFSPCAKRSDFQKNDSPKRLEIHFLCTFRNGFIVKCSRNMAPGKSAKIFPEQRSSSWTVFAVNDASEVLNFHTRVECQEMRFENIQMRKNVFLCCWRGSPAPKKFSSSAEKSISQKRWPIFPRKCVFKCGTRKYLLVSEKRLSSGWMVIKRISFSANGGRRNSLSSMSFWSFGFFWKNGKISVLRHEILLKDLLFLRVSKFLVREPDFSKWSFTGSFTDKSFEQTNPKSKLSANETDCDKISSSHRSKGMSEIVVRSIVQCFYKIIRMKNKSNICGTLCRIRIFTDIFSRSRSF